jgi:hypothetical protein
VPSMQLTPFNNENNQSQNSRLTTHTTCAMLITTGKNQ